MHSPCIRDDNRELVEYIIPSLHSKPTLALRRHNVHFIMFYIEATGGGIIYFNPPV